MVQKVIIVVITKTEKNEESFCKDGVSRVSENLMSQKNRERHVQYLHHEIEQDCVRHTGWRKKRGHHLIANILTELCGNWQYYMLNTVINFLFKNFIVEPPSENTATVVYSHCTNRQIASHSSCVFARWRHSAMKFLNKKLTTVFIT